MSKRILATSLAIFGLGVIVGYYIHGLISVELDPFLQGIITVVVTGSSFIAVVALVVEIVPIISDWLKKKEEEKLRQDKLILDDLKNWMSATTFSNIKYNYVKAEPINHKDPRDLPYFNQDIKVLKAYGALTHSEKGKTVPERLKQDGVKALEKFDRMVDKRLEKMPLKKSSEIGTLPEPYCSLPRIHEAIFEEISGSKSNFSKRPLSRMIPPPNQYSLEDGAISLAWGDNETMNRLKKAIEDIIEDENVRKEIEIYKEAKKKLDPGRSFSEFQKKINEIINDFVWNQKLKR